MCPQSAHLLIAADPLRSIGIARRTGGLSGPHTPSRQATIDRLCPRWAVCSKSPSTGLQPPVAQARRALSDQDNLAHQAAAARTAMTRGTLVEGKI